jgi:hypothetical protein
MDMAPGSSETIGRLPQVRIGEIGQLRHIRD